MALAGHSVVCGLDASPHGLRAARVAAELADRLELRLVAVWASNRVVLPAAAGVPGAVYETQELDRQAAYAAMVDAAELAGIAETASLKVEVSDPVSALLNVAEEEDAAIIVIGSPCHGRLKRLILGSVPATLQRATNRPILVVPHDDA